MISNLLRRLSIWKRLVILTLVSLVILILLGSYCATKLRKISANGLEVQKTVEWVVQELDRTKQLAQVRQATSLLLNSGDSVWIKRIKERSSQLRSSLDEENRRLLDLFLKQVDTLAVRMESLEANEKALEQAEASLVRGIGELAAACGQEDSCGQVTKEAASAYASYLPMGKALVTGRRVDGSKVSDLVDKITSNLNGHAKSATGQLKARLKALTDNFYDLDDAFSTIVAIRAKVESTKGKVIGTLNSLDQAMQQQVMAKGKEAREIANASQAMASRAVTTSTIAIILASLILIVVSFLLVRSIIDPLRKVVEVLGPMAEGDLRHRLDEDGNDELTTLAKDFNHFIEQMAAIIGNTRETVISLAGSSNELDELARQMHQEAKAAVGAAAEGSSRMSEVGNHMDQAAEMVNNLTEATNDIARNTAETAGLAENLSQRIDENRSLISTLSDHAQKVGEVIDLIRSIAEQTNLLALNATIEAARAGEAGKGFAVVANEVKELAKQTADATEQIAPLISAIQGDVEKAVVSIEESVSAADLRKDYAKTVAAAVEEQTATYQEINMVIQDINQAIQRLSQQIEVLRDKADATLGHSNKVRDNAVDLKKQSRQLDQQMEGLVV